MKSMTGFGMADKKMQGYELQVILKSVNGRFLETRFHLPKELSVYEADLKKSLEACVARGTVDIYINRRGQMGERKVEIKVRPDIVKKWLKTHDQLKKVGEKEGVQFSALSASEVMNLPHVIESFESTNPSPAEKSFLMKTFKTALSQFDKARIREGHHLRGELTQLFKDLSNLVEKMREKREKANGLLQDKLIVKFKALGFHQESLEQRLSQEILFHVDKSDITEELSRLGEHIRSCQQLLKAGQPEGKRLEFYNQELLREVNTVGSKSQLSELTALVVESKTVIEKIREQVQNIE
ncbi:MAG: YicC/YloC family endoribonuclease [Bdellovibrionota bacterium]